MIKSAVMTGILMVLASGLAASDPELTWARPLEVTPETDPSASVLEQIRVTGIMNVAIAHHAIPLSFRYPDGRLEGYCLDVIDELAEAVTVELDLNRRPLINIVTSQLGTRFDLIRSGAVQLECGPNTIRSVEGVTFSEPFLVTGIQFISERNTDPEFSPEETEAQMELGALRNSFTVATLTDRYPNATIETFAGTTGIQRGIEALQGQLDAFATDNVLLIGELAVAGRSLDEYRFSPEEPLACSPYGLLLPPQDREWSDLVNRVILGAQGSEIWESWFASVDQYLQRAEEFCGIELIPAQAVRAERDRR